MEGKMSVFANLKIKRIIAHEIFKRKDDRSIDPPDYTNEVIELGVKGTITLRDRIIKALGNGSYSLELEIEKTDDQSTFFHASKALEQDDTGFIDSSKKIAELLAEAQNSRRIPGGVILIIDGTIGTSNNRFLIIIKAETQEGFRKIKEDGHLKLQFISDLFLTPKEKLYKIGIFIEDTPTEQTEKDSSNYSAYVYDHNMQRFEDALAAQYFYKDFLGCEFKQTEKMVTRDYYFHTKQFIEELEIENDKKLDMMDSLVSELKKNQNQLINPREFADTILGIAILEDDESQGKEDNAQIQKELAEAKDNYFAYLKKNNVPDNSFQKDVTLIKPKINTRRLVFSSDIKIIGPSEDFNHAVEFIEQNDGYTTLRIRGELKTER